MYNSFFETPLFDLASYLVHADILANSYDWSKIIVIFVMLLSL